MNALSKTLILTIVVSGLVLEPAQGQPAAERYIIRPEFTTQKTGDPYNLSPRRLKRPKVGLVLSGGGARGIAHVGVIKAFENHNIPIDFISGNSMGAIIGALYAAGYTTTELENIATSTNWSDLLSFSEDTRRSELYLDQKQAQEQSFLLFRLDGVVPIIPSALSSGQRLTNALTILTFQALYHPEPTFDNLKIPFRTVATDLISGRRVVIGEGSLAEALRATVTVPLLFTPLKRDSMSLVDGGLVTNAPVDLAREAGCDLIIGSNTTGAMRPPSQLEAPWETADQIMTIMMQASNEKQFSMADIVITPELGNRLSTEFANLDSVVLLGEKAAERYVDTIQTLLRSRWNTAPTQLAHESSNHGDPRHRTIHKAQVSFRGDDFPEGVKNAIRQRASGGVLTTEQIEEDLRQTFAAGSYTDVYAEISEASPTPTVTYHAAFAPVFQRVQFRGNTRVDDATILDILRPLFHKPINYVELRNSLERLIKLYRDQSHSLARIDSLDFEAETGTLRFAVNEGIIHRVAMEGNNLTRDYVIRREFPQEDGELFDIRKALRGIVNINSTGLFEYALIDVVYEAEHPVVVLKVEEKSPNSIRIGLRADNERSFQGLVDIRDANLFGSGAELGFTFASSSRNRLSRIEYRANRIFNTLLTFNMRGYYRFDDVFTYANSPTTTDRQWERMTIGEYRQIKAGGTLTFGAQLERLGNISGELRVENQEIQFINGTGYTPEEYKLVSLKVGTTIDTKNRFPFPTSGLMFNISYESAMQKLGSDVAFGKLFMTYENYATVFQNHTFRPKITVGVADATMPLAEHFSLGGLPVQTPLSAWGEHSLFGVREHDNRGRQLFIVNVEYRFLFPFRVVFDTYFLLRYDLGMISSVHEEIRLDKFRHGIGAELALDTPIGPASFGAGHSFFLRRDLRDKPLSTGPILFYFSIGYGI